MFGKAQKLIDVIEWQDYSPDILVQRFPAEGSGDFKFGSQLIVRESQCAVFFRDGKALDVFGPGRHTLTTANLPLVYMATIEDSSEAIVSQLVQENGKLNEKVDIPLPVEGLLNPELAHRFDDFTEKNSAYALSPVTIAANMDKDFPTLHPKQLRRVVLGPFYSAGFTEHNSTVAEVLSKVRKPESAWLLTWTIQEVYSKAERPGRKGLWSSEKATQEFHIETDDLEAARQGVSAYENHALIPHEAYQALYAAGEAQKIFSGYKVHILSKGQVISDV